MKRKLVLFILLAAFLVTNLVFNCGPTVAQAQEKVIRWKGQQEYFLMPFPGPGIKEQGGMGTCLVNVAGWIKDVTNGRVVVDIAPPGSIVPSAEVMKGIGRGVLDISVNYAAFWTGTIPEGNFETGPPYSWLTDSDLYEFMYLRGAYDIIREAYLEHNVYWTPMPIGGPYAILSKSAIPSVKDLKGKKIRVGGSMADLFRAFGASPTILPIAETYMALKLGTIDAGYYSPSALKEAKLQEVVSYCMYSPTPTAPYGALLINNDKWKALPSDIKDILEKNIKHFTWSQYFVTAISGWMSIWGAEKEAGVKPVTWPNSDIPLIMEKAVPLWEKMGTPNARCGKLLNILKEQARGRGLIK